MRRSQGVCQMKSGEDPQWAKSDMTSQKLGRASHQYRGGHRFESRWSPDLEIHCNYHLSPSNLCICSNMFYVNSFDLIWSLNDVTVQKQKVSSYMYLEAFFNSSGSISHHRWCVLLNGAHKLCQIMFYHGHSLWRLIKSYTIQNYAFKLYPCSSNNNFYKERWIYRHQIGSQV